MRWMIASEPIQRTLEVSRPPPTSVDRIITDEEARWLPICDSSKHTWSNNSAIIIANVRTGVSIISPFWMEKLSSSKLVRSALATLGSENMKETSDTVDLYKRFCLHAKAAMEHGALMDQIYGFYIMALYAYLAQKSEYAVLSHSLAFSHSVEAVFS